MIIKFQEPGTSRNIMYIYIYTYPMVWRSSWNPWELAFFGWRVSLGQWHRMNRSWMLDDEILKKVWQAWQVWFHWNSNTVDGRNPAPVDMVNITLFTGFHTCQVVQHFWTINSMDCYGQAWCACFFFISMSRSFWKIPEKPSDQLIFSRRKSSYLQRRKKTIHKTARKFFFTFHHCPTFPWHILGDRLIPLAPLSWSWDFTCNPLKVKPLAGDLSFAKFHMEVPETQKQVNTGSLCSDMTQVAGVGEWRVFLQQILLKARSIQHLQNEPRKKPWLLRGWNGDEILPSYVGIIS